MLKSFLRIVSLPLLIAVTLSACGQTSDVTSTETSSGENATGEEVNKSENEEISPTPSATTPTLVDQSVWMQRYESEIPYVNQTPESINVHTAPNIEATIKATLDENDGGYIQNCSTNLDWCEIAYFSGEGETGWVYMPLLSGQADPVASSPDERLESIDAQGTNADCIVNGNEFQCIFSQTNGDGSFSIESPSGVIEGDVSSISVSMIEPGIAEVSGLTTDGINSRWGEARRSNSDPACWVGSDFTVCAY